jgi:hypothetical protein
MEEGIPLLSGYEEYQVVSDMEHVKNMNYAHVDFFREMDIQYPNSRFILNIRNVDNWIRSRIYHGDGSYLNVVMENLQLSKDEVSKKWRKDFQKHYKSVTEYFKDVPNKLLVMNIETDDCAQKLVDFCQN